MAEKVKKKEEAKPKEDAEVQKKQEPEAENEKQESTEGETKDSKQTTSKEKKSSKVRRGRADEVPDWEPKTSLGRQVRNGEITDIDYVLDRGLKIMEPEIVNSLISLETDLILIGQSKGKFGGGQRRVFKQTQKKTMEGNKPQFTTMAVVGDRNGHIGLGLGKAKETVPAREKAIRRAKLNLFKIRRGCGAWEGAPGYNSIPFAVSGRCGSVRIKLFPAPKGTGLVTEKEVAKVLEMAGIQDIWSKSFGQTKNKINMIKALEDALRKLMEVKLNAEANKRIEVFEGAVIENATS